MDRDNSPDGDPSLANMTRKAIEILQKNPHGFFLFIEGKSLDLAILLFPLTYIRGAHPHTSEMEPSSFMIEYYHYQPLQHMWEWGVAHLFYGLPELPTAYA